MCAFVCQGAARLQLLERGQCHADVHSPPGYCASHTAGSKLSTCSKPSPDSKHTHMLALIHMWTRSLTFSPLSFLNCSFSRTVRSGIQVMAWSRVTGAVHPQLYFTIAVHIRRPHFFELLQEVTVKCWNWIRMKGCWCAGVAGQCVCVCVCACWGMVHNCLETVEK